MKSTSENAMLIRNITRTEYQKFLNNYGENHTDETVRKVHGCLMRCTMAI